jgi:hypothetical protein
VTSREGDRDGPRDHDFNHVPDVVLASLDDLGRACLHDKPTDVRGRLRSDLRLRVDCDRAALDAGRAPVAFRLRHGTAHDRLRDHGSFVETIVEGVEARLRPWGVELTGDYEHVGTEDGWQVYASTLRLP